MRDILELIAALLWITAWVTFGTILFIASTALLPFVLTAFMCGRLSRKGINNF
jgi:uncharacterized membrane protein